MSATIAITLWLSKDYHSIYKLLLTIPTATAVFILTAKLLRIEMLSLFTTPIKDGRGLTAGDQQPK